MFRLGSSLASKVRLPDSTIRLVPARFCWRRNFLSQNIKFCGPLIAHPANQLIQRPKLAENHTCDLDEDGLRYLSIMRQAMFFEGRKVGTAASGSERLVRELEKGDSVSSLRRKTVILN